MLLVATLVASPVGDTEYKALASENNVECSQKAL